MKQDPSLTTSLRDATRDLHDEVEARLDLASSLGSKERFRAMLLRFLPLYRTLESALCAWDGPLEAVGLGSDRRHKSELIEADLVGLGTQPEDLEALPVPPEEIVPRLAGLPEAIGCSYVLEGATLGGQLVARELRERLGLEPGQPGALFYNCYGTEVGRRWKEFRRSVDSTAMALAERERACASAVATFNAFGRWMVR